jgi:predicted permease
VLLIACLNVSGLMVVRSRARRREMAVRLALGASRRRLVHQLVVEGVMLTTAAGLLALSIAGALANAATRLQPQGSILHGVHITLDRRVLALSAIITLVTAGLLALLPAFRASRLDPMAALKATAPGSGGSRHHGQRFLVGAQIALSFALLVTGLMVTVAMERLLARSPGFDTESLVMLSVDLSAQGYAADRGLPFLTRLYERLSNEPAFSSASFAKTVPPLDWSDRISLFRPGTEPTRDALRKDMSSLGFRVQADGVGPAYFSTLRLSLLKGREFTAADDSSAPGVVVVNQSLARLLWPDGNVIGQRISWPSLDGPARKPLTVVGVIADHRYTSLTTQAAPLLYFPVLQAYDGRTTVVARARGKAGEALRALERVIRDIDPGVPTTGSMTMKQRMAATVWQQRMLATWLAAFAVLALGMSLIGLFGVVSQSVLQRGRELSVRMALGASPRAVVASVVGESVAITLGGLAVGAPLAAIGTSLARRQLVGMDGGQLEAWTLSAVVLSAAILGASYLPARRATRLNPADALRCD